MQRRPHSGSGNNFQMQFPVVTSVLSEIGFQYKSTRRGQTDQYSLAVLERWDKILERELFAIHVCVANFLL